MYRPFLALILALAAILAHRFLSLPTLSLSRYPKLSKTLTQNNMSTSTPPADILAPWLLPRLTSLYTTLPTEQDSSDFEALFSETFSDNAEIRLNHAPVSLDALREQLSAGKFAMQRADFDVRDVVEVIKESEGDGGKEGIVAGFFVVGRSLKFRIRAGPARTMSYNSFSAKIETDPSLPPTLPDRRRVMQLFLTSLDKAAPIHLRGPNAGAEEEEGTVKPSLVEKS